ncbi:ABC transporter permease [Proteinivorax hydrogeniformans]|uniref:ABC transporter permease n=1 Tax=Proteinivorax hydrogeniformans TaxID=1826727 RepID=A0AAU8HRB2_9FIRM
MSTYILRRLLQMIPVFIGITIVSFSIVHLAPGSPIDLFTGPDTHPDELARLQELWGLNDPVYVQYGRWFSSFITGDLGRSFRTGDTVLNMLVSRLPNTIQLNVFSLVFALAVSIPVGIFSALRQYSIADYVATFITFFGIAMPNFWYALLLIYLFYIKLEWLPGMQMRTIGISVETHGYYWVIVDRIRHLILPTIVMGTSAMASFTRYMRASMLQVIREDYVRTARAKGLSERVVIYKHALRNSMIPLVTILTFTIPSLLAGSVVIETIFSWPGVGRTVFQAIGQRDYNIVMAFNTVMATLTLVFMLIADIAYVVVDPRIRFD